MKKKLSLVATPIIALAAASAQADLDFGFTPYVGADIQYRHMNYKTGYGDNLYAKHQPQGNIYVGAKFHEYFGIEGGIQATQKQGRNASLYTGDTNLGVYIDSANTNIQYKTTVRTTASHLSLVGFLPISEEYRLKLIGLAGVSVLKTTVKRTHTVLVRLGVPLPNDLSPPLTNSQRKSVLRLGAGLEHMFAHNWGIRTSFIWENTNKMSLATTNDTSGRLAKPKNSLTYGLGAFVSF